jgi:hypothetical protein
MSAQHMGCLEQRLTCLPYGLLSIPSIVFVQEFILMSLLSKGTDMFSTPQERSPLLNPLIMAGVFSHLADDKQTESAVFGGAKATNSSGAMPGSETHVLLRQRHRRSVDPAPIYQPAPVAPLQLGNGYLVVADPHVSIVWSRLPQHILTWYSMAMPKTSELSSLQTAARSSQRWTT